MADESNTAIHHPADTNGDGKVSKAEEQMYLEFKRKELEDLDAMRDAQRSMAWFALSGMLLYPFAVPYLSKKAFGQGTRFAEMLLAVNL